jgi:hypothetical protein
MILQLSAVEWSDLLRGDYVDECVQEFYLPKYIVKNSTVKYPWFDRELHNVDNDKTKAHKHLKKLKLFIFARCLNRISACTTRLSTVFGNLGATLSLHRLQYAQYIMRIEGGLKNKLRGFFKCADMKRNAIFLENDCARDSQSIGNLFAGFFQSVYLRDDLIQDSDLQLKSPKTR